MLIISCDRSSGITGAWRNEKRTLVFTGDSFCIIYHTDDEVRGLKGNYVRNGNEIILSFKEYSLDEKEWISVEGTDLENHEETLAYSIKGDRMRTLIKTTGKVYEYERE